MSLHFHSIGEIWFWKRKKSINQNYITEFMDLEDGENFTKHPAHHHVTNTKYWPFATYKFCDVPPNFKERDIYTGYRSPTSTVFECFKYLFYPNNEMMNVWTHLIAFIVTSVYFFRLSYVGGIDFINDPYSWPLMVYMFNCCLYPLVSAIAHMFSCLSSRARHILFFMDYAAISVYGLATNLAHYAYSFPGDFRRTSLKYLYLPISLYNSALMPLLSCESRFVEFSPYCKNFRLLGFIIPAVWGFSPLVFRLFLGNPKLNNSTPETLKFHRLQFVVAGISSVLYGSRFPERAYPGNFDVFFHSHQIFHVFGSIGTMCQMWGILGDYYYFRKKPFHDPACFTYEWSFGFWSAGAIWNIIIVACCIRRVFFFKNEQLYKILMHCPRVMCYPPDTWPDTVWSVSSSSSSSSGTDIKKVEEEAFADESDNALLNASLSDTESAVSSILWDKSGNTDDQRVAEMPTKQRSVRFTERRRRKKSNRSE